MGAEKADFVEDVPAGGWISGASVDWFEFTLFDRAPDFLRGVSGDDEAIRAIVESYEDKSGARRWDKILNYGNNDDEKPEIKGARVDGVWTGEALRPFRRVEKSGDIHFMPFDVEDVPALLGISAPLEKAARGMLGYKTRHTLAGVQVLSEGSGGMGVHVICSADPVKMHRLNVPALCGVVLAEAGKASRIDLAVDDFDGALDLDVMVKSCKAGEASSRMKQWTVIESGFFKAGEITGRTLYAGARTSDVMIRAYDKRLERIAAGAVVSKLPEKWVRVEVEIKGQAAQNVQKLLAAGVDVSRLAVDLINNYLGFKVRGTDSNKSRWALCPWWLEWLAGAGRASVSRSVMPPTMESRAKWFNKQVNKTMAILARAHGSEWLESSYNAGVNKLTVEDVEKIKTFKAKKRREDMENER